MLPPPPYSYVKKEGDGSTDEFTFTFDYLLKAHVYVYVDETLLVDGVGYVWTWDKQVTLTTPPTTEQVVTIRRDTPEDDQIVDWTDGTHIIADTLNTSDLQWLYNIQELEDQIHAVDRRRLIQLRAPRPSR